jgi:hypothetical protein
MYTSIGDRISQLSSALATYGANGALGAADSQTNLDNAHASRLARDELARLSGFYPVTSTGGLVNSTTTANLVTESTGLSPFGIASTKYATSGQP